MSTMASPASPSESYERPEVTWRDAVTPLSRASRRRWTACYALLLAALAASVVDDAFAVGRNGDEAIPLILVAALPVVFGMLRRGTRRIAALDHPDLDERDVAARNSAYRIAFPLLLLVVVAALILLAIAVPEIERTIRVGREESTTTGGLFVQAQALTGVGLWIGLWALFLPTGVLAWREPDALEAETDDQRLPESLRDAVLGLAVAGGLLTSLIADSDVGLIAFIAALALLGGLSRRAEGQPMVSRQRKWRVAIGIVLILIVVAIAVVPRLA